MCEKRHYIYVYWIAFDELEYFEFIGGGYQKFNEHGIGFDEFGKELVSNNESLESKSTQIHEEL